MLFSREKKGGKIGLFCGKVKKESAFMLILVLKLIHGSLSRLFLGGIILLRFYIINERMNQFLYIRIIPLLFALSIKVEAFALFMEINDS